MTLETARIVDTTTSDQTKIIDVMTLDPYNFNQINNELLVCDKRTSDYQCVDWTILCYEVI